MPTKKSKETTKRKRILLPEYEALRSKPPSADDTQAAMDETRGDSPNQNTETVDKVKNQVLDRGRVAGAEILKAFEVFKEPAHIAIGKRLAEADVTTRTGDHVVEGMLC